MSYNTCIIKNISNIDQSVSGVILAPTEQYTVPDSKRLAIAGNDTILQRLASGELQVGDGSKFFSSINDQINWLKNNLPTEVKQLAIAEPAGKRARLIGTHNATAPSNQSSNHDWLIPQLQYAGVNTSSIFDGIQYYAWDANFGDYLTFQVIDKDGAGVALGLYPQAYYDAYKDANGVLVVEEFGDKWYIAPNSMQNIILYKARLYSGLHLRVKYTNVGTETEVKFFCNLFRHLDP